MTSSLRSLASALVMFISPCLAAMLGVSPAQATTPYTPRSDKAVVEVLRDRPLSAEEKQWRTLRAQARAQPQNVDLALQVARQALQWGRRDGDPRLIGQAQAALGTWWAAPAPPTEVRLLRAVILQSTHEFPAALRDLRAVVAIQPRQTQAWLTLASVLQVTGQYDEAQAACAALAPAGAPWHGQACTLELASLRGEADRASTELTALARRAPRELAPYINLIRAELAERQGQTAQANSLYVLLLNDEPDAYTQGAYADFLLDQQRPKDVISRLKGQERNDALLLRLAEAYAATGDDALGRTVQTLKARFAAARERGDSVHRREEARFTLRLLKRPAEALKLAKANWQVQKEPADARILLEAAQAAQEPSAGELARTFIKQAGWSDKRLEALL
jgi:hypothetical protein